MLEDEDMDSGEWVPYDALLHMIQEKNLNPDESYEDLANRTMREQAPIVAQSMVRLAVHSKNETTRLNAGRYVLDRVLGKLGDAKLDDVDNPLTKLRADIEAFVNASS